MLSREENALLTRVGPGTPMGELIRRYWVPALLSEEIAEPDCPPVRVKILGESLVAFRDTQGRVGLLAEHCAHRGTSLFYGRNEDSGLRCIYHGWKYDVAGRVVETPAEPAGSNLKYKVRHTAYPCRESAGIVFAYLGPEDKMPVFPDYPWARLGGGCTRVIKAYLECNYLQGLEGDFDSSHTSFLHRERLDDPASLKRDGAPDLDGEEADFGMRAISIRQVGSDTIYVRISLFILPTFSMTPGAPTPEFKPNDPMDFRFWVPIDDFHTWFYVLDMREVPFSEEEKQQSRSWVDGAYRRIGNAQNDYLQDRQRQKTSSYSGIRAIRPAEQDACATESMGPIYDRSQEHLGLTDTTVIALRRLLLKSVKAVQEGQEPPHVIRDPTAKDFSHLRPLKGILPATASWREWF